MPLLISIQPVPSQQVSCVLGGQNCQIAIYQKGNNVYVDLNSDGTDMSIAVIGLNAVPLDSCNSYDGFEGNLYFIDTQGSDDPQYTGFGSRWVLIYLTAVEVALAEQVTVIPQVQVNLSLAAILNVTSSAPGAFSVPHGLSSTPILIGIVPTSGGAIWGQAGFADATNVNLVASDTGLTSKIYIYVPANTGVAWNLPKATLNVTSPAPGAFSVPHGLGVIPSLVEILPTSGVTLWGQDPIYDDTNVYLVASDAGVVGKPDAILTLFTEDPLTIAGPAISRVLISGGPGLLAFQHGLLGVPSRISILNLSDGLIWAQTPAFDSSNVYLIASDSGILFLISVYA